MSIFTPSRQSRKAATTRRSIVEAAELIIGEGGQRALTIEAVAERADVAVQTIYNRVGGRDAILVAVAEQALEDNGRFMDAAYDLDGTVDERVAEAIRSYARFAVECPTQFKILADPPDVPEALTAVADILERRNARTRDILDDGIREGLFDPHLDRDATAVALWGMANGVLALQWRTDRLRATPAELERMIIATTSIFIRGLRPLA